MSDEIQPSPPSRDGNPSKKQRALNALVFLLAVAVMVQAYMLYELHEQLTLTVAKIERNLGDLDATDWKTIPRDADSGHSTTPQASQSIPLPLPQGEPLTRDPFADLDRIRQEMERLMQRSQSRSPIAPQVSGISRTGRSQRLLLEDLGGEYVVRAALPGADEANITVKVENQVLYICIKNDRSVQSTRDGQPFTQERVSSKSYQHVPLREPVDAGKLTTKFDDGVLTVTIPKVAMDRAEQEPSESVRGD